MSRFRDFIIPVFGIFLLAVIYFLTFPTTVQTGDTGELVANSFFLRVIHPPGYPIFTLIYHAFLKIFPGSTVFGRASIFTIIISLSWIGILLVHFRSYTGLLILVIAGTSSLFWRYALLPDVFALHLFFLSLVLLAIERPLLLEKPWYLFLVSLSVAHHHTIVFAFPLFIYAFLRTNRIRVLVLSFILGAVSFSLYALLTKFHPEEMFSWNFITSPSAVIQHFLRTEYGTFQLSIRKERDFEWVYLLSKTILVNYWSLLLVSGFLILKKPKKTKTLLWPDTLLLLSVGLYFLVFIIGGSISLNFAGEGIFERFLLHPFMIFLFLFLRSSSYRELPKWLTAALVVNVFSNVFSNWRSNNFSGRTVVEDYTINILNSLPNGSIYNPLGDTESFSAYYVREVLGIRKDVILLPSVGTTQWGEKKLSKHFPDAYRNSGPELLEKINFDRYQLFSNQLFSRVPTGLAVTFYGLVYRYQKSDGTKIRPRYECEVASRYEWRSIPDKAEFVYFDYGNYLYLTNGNCFFSAGVDALKGKDGKKALEEFSRGNELSPMNVRVLDGKCRALSLIGDARKASCDHELEDLMSNQSQQYYLFKF